MILSFVGIKSIDADKLGHLTYLPGTECFGKLVVSSIAIKLRRGGKL